MAKLHDTLKGNLQLIVLLISFVSGFSLLLMIMLGYGPWYIRLAGMVYLMASAKVFVYYSDQK